MTEDAIRQQFDEAITNGDFDRALKLIHQAEALGYDSYKMRDIYAIRDLDSHND